MESEEGQARRVREEQMEPEVILVHPVTVVPADQTES